MTGGLMQLVAYGAQDIYLTGNPMITYFKVVYRRHTNFAMESIEQTFNGEADLGTNVSAIISRNGDLINGIYLQTTLPNLSGTGNGGQARWVDNVGHFLISQVSIEIGGQTIDTHYGDWLEIWSQLTVPAGQKVGYLEMIGQDQVDTFGRLTGLQAETLGNNGLIPGRTIYVPLQFWFCRNIGLALPLIALQYHEVKINMVFNVLSNLTQGNDPAAVNPQRGTTILSNTSLWVDYIFLDTEERRRFAQITHEYLIEQIQLTQANITCDNTRVLSSNNPPSTITVRLNFNHPVKELIWVIKNNNPAFNRPSQPANYTSVASIDTIAQTAIGSIGNLPAGGSGNGGLSKQSDLLELIGQGSINPPGALNPVITAQLLLNGHDRFSTRIGDYFNLYQTVRHHTCAPESPGINVYSFALFPEQHQPSGTCNFSRIDNAYLVLTAAIYVGATGDISNYPGIHDTQQTYPNGNSVISVYAVNYNVLRITNGMGGIAYNN